MRDKLELLREIERWKSGQAEPITPLNNDEARLKLERAGLSAGDIAEKQAQLVPSEPRILASYTDLHGLDRLDAIDSQWDEPIAQQADESIASHPEVQFIRAVFQASEIALLNLQDLVERATTDIEVGDYTAAADKQAWIDSLQTTLVEWSKLASRYSPEGDSERTISFSDSPHLGRYTESLEAYHKAIVSAGLIEPDAIGHTGLHDAGRRISFNAFNNETYQQLWQMHLSGIPLPAIRGTQGLDANQFYEQFVGTDCLDKAVNEVKQKGDNFFTQFRCYHQMSEIFCRYANQRLADVSTRLLDDDADLSTIEEELSDAAAILAGIEHNVHPILRNLVPQKYQEIRGSLGITSGSHSPNVRKGLFKTTYPILAESALYRLTGADGTNEQEVLDALSHIKANRHTDFEANAKYKVMEHVKAIHDTVRNWRDLHMQFVKTQIGISPSDMRSTASISGATNAMHSARGMRFHGHSNEPAAPIIETLSGKPYNAPENHQDTLSLSDFGEVMGANTARIIDNMSSAVQDRIHGGRD